MNFNTWRNSRNRQTAEYLQKLNPGKDIRRLLSEYGEKRKKRMAAVFLAGILLSALVMISDLTSGEIGKDGRIFRNGYGEADKNITASVQSPEYEDFEIDVSVAARKYTQKEAEEAFANAKDRLDQEIKGENESLDAVQKALYFPTEYASGSIELTYTTSDSKRIDAKGRVFCEDLYEPEQVIITVGFSCGEWEDTKDYTVTVIPPKLSLQEQFVKKVQALVAEADSGQNTTDSLKLPDDIDGTKVQYKNTYSYRFVLIFVLGAGSSVLIAFSMDEDLKKKTEERKKELLYEYPEFISKLALLMGAGMSLSGALRRIYADHNKNLNPLYEELGIVIHNLDNGILEERAMEDFGKRTGLVEYRKFCSLLAVNLKKGAFNVKEMLEKEAEDAFLKHQSLIRKRGEEAGTKLLLPMVMMLVLVVAIIMIPAFLTYQIA